MGDRLVPERTEIGRGPHEAKVGDRSIIGKSVAIDRISPVTGTIKEPYWGQVDS
jgi:hypothetical protein